jgi:probable addiction module antidote protein
MSLRTTAFDAADYLDSAEAVAAYIDAALETGDAAFIAAALGDVARAKGMTKLAREANVTRDSLYKALKQDGNPTLSTFMGVLSSLGLELHVRPAGDGR